MTVTIKSFLYKHGLPEDKMAIGNIGIGNIPTLATFDMFDCRAMPNPYWDESLRGGRKLGKDKTEGCKGGIVFPHVGSRFPL